jgi:hypothetical protein
VLEVGNILLLNMATISYVTHEEHETSLQRIERLERLLEAYITSNEEWLPKEQAIRIAGLKTRDSLEKYARTTKPGIKESGHIVWRKTGVKCLYLRSSCIDYAQRKLGQPALRK